VKKRQYIENAKARNAKRAFVGEQWQVPTLGWYHPSPAESSTCALEFKGKPHDTILDIVRGAGFKFDWENLIWYLPSEESLDEKRNLANSVIEQIEELVKRRGEGPPKHTLKEVAEKYAPCPPKDYKGLNGPCLKGHRGHAVAAIGKFGTLVHENEELKAKLANAEARVKELVACSDAQLAEAVAMKQQLKAKDAHIEVLKLEAHGRSAASTAKPVTRGPYISCQGDEDGDI
jgi:hypothetical protein